MLKLVNWILPGLLCFSLFLPLAAQATMPVAIIGKNIVKLEVAQTEKQVERGLMYRTSLPADSGMVFLFNPPRPVRFWMFHCFISLDMLFVKDGKIIKICHDVPPSKSTDPHQCPLYPAEGEVEASEVVEVNAGYAARHGIKEGDIIKFELPGIK